MKQKYNQYLIQNTILTILVFLKRKISQNWWFPPSPLSTWQIKKKKRLVKKKEAILWGFCFCFWEGSTVRPYLQMVQSGMSGMLLSEEKGGIWYISASLQRLVCASHLGNLETGSKRSGVASWLDRYMEKTCCYCKYHALLERVKVKWITLRNKNM